MTWAFLATGSFTSTPYRTWTPNPMVQASVYENPAVNLALDLSHRLRSRSFLWFIFGVLSESGNPKRELLRSLWVSPNPKPQARNPKVKPKGSETPI